MGAPTTAAALAPPAAAPARRRMRPADALTLVAVALVVLLVSLPRLRELALRENQGDARRLVARLAEVLVQRDVAQASPSVRALLEEQPSLRRQLQDAEFLEDGRLLRRHGYLFDVVELPRHLAVRAWPERHGQSGLAAFAWAPHTGAIGHANDDGRWSAGAPPSVPGDPEFDPAGWRILSARD